jgi:hypothetical protein
VKNRSLQINSRKMAVRFSRTIVVSFMEQVTSHWNVDFAIMNAAAWVQNATLLSKKTGRLLPVRLWLKNGSGRLV